MKKIFFLITALIIWIGAVASRASAYEGSIDLSGSSVSCKASSVWHESRYRVIGRCEGLVYPYETQYEYYTVWAYDVSRQTYARLDDVDRGYFEGDISTPFDKLMITAEQDGGPRRPSDKTVATGSVTKFSFDKSEVSATPTPVVTESKATTVQNKATTTTTASNTGSVVGRIITSLLVIILVVVGIVIAGSLLFRSRGSVSA